MIEEGKIQGLVKECKSETFQFDCKIKEETTDIKYEKIFDVIKVENPFKKSIVKSQKPSNFG